MKNKLKKIVLHAKSLLRGKEISGEELFLANAENIMFRPRGQLDATYVESTTSGAIDDRGLVARVCDAYASRTKEDTGRSMWSDFFMSHHADVDSILLSKNYEAAAHLLRNPALSNIFYGFDIFAKDFIGLFKSRRVQEAYADLCLDGLVRFAEAVGAMPLENPETRSNTIAAKVSADFVISRLQDYLGWSPDSPNPYASEPGLASKIGVISYRVPQAMFQAWRIKQLVASIKKPRIVEIGAGLGRTAYYAKRLGITDYTIVDLPVSTAAQGYFLGSTLGDSSVYLEGESDTSDLDQRVKIISPATFRNSDQRYDLVVNFDSLTEMDASIAAGYWHKSKSISNTLLSVNHEINVHRVRDLINDDSSVLSSERLSYWMRRGYVEEIVRWS